MVSNRNFLNLSLHIILLGITTSISHQYCVLPGLIIMYSSAEIMVIAYHTFTMQFSYPNLCLQDENQVWNEKYNKCVKQDETISWQMHHIIHAIDMQFPSQNLCSYEQNLKFKQKNNEAIRQINGRWQWQYFTLLESSQSTFSAKTWCWYNYFGKVFPW